MTVNKIKVDSFGSLRDREFTFSDSLNIIEGANESGKTAAAMFIKFMFYGLSGRSSDAFPISERKRFVNWDTAAPRASCISPRVRGVTVSRDRSSSRTALTARPSGSAR